MSPPEKSPFRRPISPTNGNEQRASNDHTENGEFTHVVTPYTPKKGDSHFAGGRHRGKQASNTPEEASAEEISG
jgi:hypothetical protein